MKIILTPYIYILLFLIQSGVIFSQNYNLILKAKSKNNIEVLKQFEKQRKYSSVKEIYNELDSIIKQIEVSGFINAEIDSVNRTNNTVTAFLNLNNRIEEIQINHNGQLNKNILSEISNDFDNNYFTIQFEDIPKNLNRISQHFESQGSTFAQASLINIEINQNSAEADLLINQSIERKIDKVIIKGYENFPEAYIKYALDLKEGSTFNLEKLNQASTNLKNIPFATETKAPQVLFSKDSTFIYLFIDKKKSNTFDGMIGFSSKTTGNGLDFNGYLNASVQNIFNKGETIAVQWKNNGNDSQKFNLQANAPYVFASPITPEISLNIYRQDSTFNNVDFRLSVFVDILKNSTIGGVFNSENSSNLLSQNIDNSVESFKKNSFGLNFVYRIPNNSLLFPYKFNLNFNSFFGNRVSNSIKTNQTEFSVSINYLWALNQSNFIFLQNQSGVLNSDTLYTNELYRIGGVRTIRGFNEESLFASLFSIFNIEYRYKTTINSYFYTITDFAYLQNQIEETNSNNYSLGLGYSFLAKIGRIELSYALGKFENEPFDFNNSKFHINIINYF